MAYIVELIWLILTLFPLVLFFTKRQRRGHRLPPGPTALPIIGHFHLLGPLIHHSFHILSSCYGPLIHLKLGSVPCVVASKPELAKRLLKTHELTFSARKHSIAIDGLTYGSSFAFAEYGPYWKFIKKFSTVELLGSRCLNRFLPVRGRELYQFLQVLRTKAKVGESVNLTQEILKLSSNIISEMMFGVKCMGNHAEDVRTLVREVTQIFGEFNTSDFIWFCRNLDIQGFRRRFEGVRRRYDALLEKIISDRDVVRRKNSEGERVLGSSGSSDDQAEEVKDFLDMLRDVMSEKTAEIALTRNHIKALALDFLTAATDTTAAIALEWSLAELINHPNILKKAVQEIDKVVGTTSLVQDSDIPHLPYVQAIIKETLRLHPPIPMLSRKSTQECQVDGYTIPPDTLLFVNIWSTARDPRNWENPTEFQPERFLTENLDVRGQHFQLLPFGSGRRSCPGMSFALLELPTTLAALLQRFEWAMAAGPDGSKVNRTNVVDMAERPGLTAPRVGYRCFVHTT